ncbi:type II toxin-antitoxin system HicB family antitoxin [Lysobacter sp. TY2-98]|uniref:type II toxin-antitoxin system HicB family antitoxin n=1 Tax=Lysobacter sp. TY2-98 TaxID=2290922 RepID=UPI0013B3B6F7|nr:type II toxin-antitoxin system HicB family antitoxin [Lysobacter sp. TY2-98]
MNRGYFAFVRRDAERHYHATLPDFPGCSAQAERLVALNRAVREAVMQHVRTAGWPVPTRLEALPRQPDDDDGFWLMVDITPDG